MKQMAKDWDSTFSIIVEEGNPQEHRQEGSDAGREVSSKGYCDSIASGSTVVKHSFRQETALTSPCDSIAILCGVWGKMLTSLSLGLSIFRMVTMLSRQHIAVSSERGVQRTSHNIWHRICAQNVLVQRSLLFKLYPLLNCNS